MIDENLILDYIDKELIRINKENEESKKIKNLSSYDYRYVRYLEKEIMTLEKIKALICEKKID